MDSNRINDLTKEQRDILNWKLLEQCYQGNLEEIKNLIAAGADPNYEWIGTSLTPLHTIVNQDEAAETFKNSTNFQVANKLSEERKIEITKFLIAAGADVNYINTGGSTPLMALTRNEDSEDLKLAEFLIELGANPKHTGDFGIDLVQIACDKDKLMLAKTLLNKGATLNPVHEFMTLRFKIQPDRYINKLKDFFITDCINKIRSANQELKLPLNLIRQVHGFENTNNAATLKQSCQKQILVSSKIDCFPVLELQENLKNIGLELTDEIKLKLEEIQIKEETKEDLVNSSAEFSDKNIDRGEETYYNTGQNSGSSSESNYLDLFEEQRKEETQPVTKKQEQEEFAGQLG